MRKKPLLRLKALAETKRQSEPYDFLIVPEFVEPAVFEELHQDFPRVAKGGSWPVNDLKVRPIFKQLIEELESTEMRKLVEEKFNLDLSDKPTMITVRGQGRSKDGGIHTDSIDKVITLLLYVNREWPHEGGRLRILRNGQDIQDYAAEIAPVRGNLLIFKRSDHSWHGHLPAADQRLSLQMNWMIDRASRDSELERHHRSAWLKRLWPFGKGGPAY
ncbi:MAG: 2OG-Fe(II) oxygenase [Candidatus Pacebacteria bacterium]|nr:2OG-Fe(II) oxygenase [Candidatus Paceibacterota bacterium]